ncbi:MAG: sugar phosphate nucleotidyltransferase [Ignavibacteria bacterium]|nr:sugar phosphate nucleotidyltransferase [Ignavibacteria bacterium]
MKRVGIIMAGGTGERFWPVSRTNKPKQLLPLNTDIPLLLETLNRISPVISSDDTFILTNVSMIQPIIELLPNFPLENIIVEPYKKNTAPAIVLGISYILARYEKEFSTSDISVGIFTSDQMIYPQQAFIETIEQALEYVEKFPFLATIGIIPTRPETGYGYIELEKPFETNIWEIAKVVRFREKPDYETAKVFLETGRFLWNSGMFFWRADTFLDEAKVHLPDIANKIDELKDIFQKDFERVPFELIPKITPIFSGFSEISIDYALMEKSNRIVVVPAKFSWDDIGAWDSLDRTKAHDEFGNVSLGNNLLIDTRNTIVFNASSNNKIKVALIGLDNFVVVATDDAFLVCPKTEVQKVKKCVEKLKTEPDGNLWI